MGEVVHLPHPLPKVHECGCGSQVFHLCENTEVVCVECGYIIDPLRVVRIETQIQLDMVNSWGKLK